MPNNQEANDALMTKLYEIVAAPDNITKVPKDTPFVSFCRPGIPLTPQGLDFGFVTMTRDQNALAADFADIANDIPSMAGFYSPTARKVFDEYFKVINAPVLPIAELTEAEKKQLQEAKDFLFKDELRQDIGTGKMVRVVVETLIHERYKDYETQWQGAFDKYQTELENFLYKQDDTVAVEIWSRKEPILKDKVARAYKEWEAAGKAKVEEMTALIGNLERRGPNALWAERRERYKSHTRSDNQGGNYQLTKYFPQKFWDNGTWSTFTFTHNEVHQIDTSVKTSFGGGGGVGFGLWSFGGNYQRDTTDTHNEADISNFSLSVEICRVPLRRTWMDAGVFTNRSWKFDKSISEAEYLSDGENPPRGSMVAFSTALIVARNLNIQIDISNEKNSYSLEKINASLRAGWGPFSIKGNYSKETAKQTHDFVQTGSGIEAKGMQIIGFVCQVLPKCPDPDTTLKWPKDDDKNENK
jgi:hypothetical protein